MNETVALPHPPLDTTHTGRGYYMYVKPSDGIFWDDATFELQQVLQPSSASCRLEFWHHMIDRQFISVHLLEGDESVEIWEEDHAHGDQWEVVNIPLGRIARPWRMQFLAESSWGDGTVAIDDVRLVGCQYPPVRPNCTDDQFRCQRGACVPKDRVCDFR